jgi:hypothetical protein
MERYVNYFTTTESLNSIITGLTPSPDDKILAIAGSGDQGFAMLEYGARVTLVDSDENAIDFVKDRAEALKNGDFRGFFYPKGWSPPSLENLIIRNRYFNVQWPRYFSSRRVRKIRSNLGGLTILPCGKIGQNRLKQRFTKIYLSNAWSVCGNFLDNLLLDLVPNGLIYSAIDSDFISYLLVNDGFCLDRLRTKQAREQSQSQHPFRWNPAVWVNANPKLIIKRLEQGVSVAVPLP